MRQQESLLNPVVGSSVGRVQSALLASTVILAFVPFIKIIPVDAVHQPIAAVPALLLGVLGLWRMDRAVFALLGLSALVMLFTIQSLIRYDSHIETLAQAFAYLSPVIVGVALRGNIHLIPRVVPVALMILFVSVGLMQELNIFHQIYSLLGLGNVFTFIYSEKVGGGRGVAFLTSEPSIGALFLFSIACLFYTMNLSRRYEKKVRYGFIGSFIICVFLNRSATIVVLLAIMSLLLAVTSRGSERLRVLFTVGIFTGMGVLLSILDVTRGEASRLQTMYNNVKWLSETTDDFTVIAAALAGKRLVTVYVGYASLFESGMLGYGVGAHRYVFSKVATGAGADLSRAVTMAEHERIADSFKPDSYLSSVSLEMGIIGVIAVAAVAWCLCRGPGSVGQYFAVRMSFAAVAAFLLVLHGNSTLITPWLLLVLSHDLADLRCGRPALAVPLQRMFGKIKGVRQ